MPLECPLLQVAHPCSTHAAEVAKNNIADLVLTSAPDSEDEIQNEISGYVE
jgi:hypothetical protein